MNKEFLENVTKEISNGIQTVVTADIPAISNSFKQEEEFCKNWQSFVSFWLAVERVCKNWNELYHTVYFTGPELKYTAEIRIHIKLDKGCKIIVEGEPYFSPKHLNINRSIPDLHALGVAGYTLEHHVEKWNEIEPLWEKAVEDGIKRAIKRMINDKTN